MDLSRLVSRLEELGRMVASKPGFRWGMVTNANPLQVQLDGDSTPLVGSPATLVGDLQVGDRVRVEQQAARLTVHGKALATPEAVGFETAGVARVPALTHMAGVQLVDMIRTARIVLQPGMYRVSWPVKFEITWTGATNIDASGAYIHAYKTTGGNATQVQWADGSTRVAHWGSYVPGQGYGTSTLEGWLEVPEPGEYEFVGGLHSYLKLKLEAWESVFLIEKFPRALEIDVTKIS